MLFLKTHFNPIKPFYHVLRKKQRIKVPDMFYIYKMLWGKRFVSKLTQQNVANMPSV